MEEQMEAETRDGMEFEYRSSCANEHFFNLADIEDQYDYLKTILEDNVIKVKFEKKNLDIREMFCTLDEDVIPDHKEYYLADGSEREKTKHNLAVFDLEKNDWRSFRISSVKEIMFMGERDLMNELME